jgi:hypothetical protein
MVLCDLKMKSRKNIHTQIEKLQNSYKIQKDMLDYALQFPEENPEQIPLLKENIKGIENVIEWLLWVIGDYEKWLVQSAVDEIENKR